MWRILKRTGAPRTPDHPQWDQISYYDMRYWAGEEVACVMQVSEPPYWAENYTLHTTWIFVNKPRFKDATSIYVKSLNIQGLLRLENWETF
jgi:hypothetical protein